MGAEPPAQGGVEQMGGAVIGADLRPALGVDGEMDGVATETSPARITA